MNKDNNLVRITKKEFNKILHGKRALNIKKNNEYLKTLNDVELYEGKYKINYYLNLYNNEVEYTVEDKRK